MCTSVSGSGQDGDQQVSIEDGSRIDTHAVHSARRYNYWLGGKDHFQADRDSGDAIADAFPSVRLAAMENRAFMRRAVTYLVREAGVRQFLDIGTGIPAPNNTHEVAQSIAPESRVVYVDNDPIVMSHARALLTSAPEGKTAYIEADLRDHEKILSDQGLRTTLDFSQPVALMLIAILHFLNDADDPYRVVAQLANALPEGSYLVASHGTADFTPVPVSHRLMATLPQGSVRPRTRDEFARFFDGMDLVDPGLVHVSSWRDDDEARPRPATADVPGYAAVARIG
jgi:hypothetical protein